MSGYLLSVIGIVLFSSILIAVLPNGKTADMIRGITRIACVITMLSPVVYFFVDGGNFDGFFGEKGIETEAAFIQYCSEERIEQAEILLQKELSEKYDGIHKIEMQWESEAIHFGGYTANGVKIVKIVVFVNQALSDHIEREIIEYLFNQYGCEGQVIHLEKVVG
ncbi:MAG: hypothetical protein IJD33_00545 [Clostridia bacterium]|nr:hypothetical protein [Clostridia bacterium]